MSVVLRMKYRNWSFQFPVPINDVLAIFFFKLIQMVLFVLLFCVTRLGSPTSGRLFLSTLFFIVHSFVLTIGAVSLCSLLLRVFLTIPTPPLRPYSTPHRVGGFTLSVECSADLWRTLAERDNNSTKTR